MAASLGGTQQGCGDEFFLPGVGSSALEKRLFSSACRHRLLCPIQKHLGGGGV